MMKQDEPLKKDTLKEIGQDLTGSIKEEGISMVLENLPEVGNVAAQILGNEKAATVIRMLTGGVLGAVAPALYGITLAYQQRRVERNVANMLNSVQKYQDIIEQRLNMLETEMRQKFIDGPYRDALLDNIVSENQEQKVQYNINGYINLMMLENPNDDVVFTFFNTLAQMNALDIRVLRLYNSTFGADQEHRETYLDVIKEEGIDESQYKFIQEKLYRLGMLYSVNETRRDENLDTISQTLTDLTKQLSSKNPKPVKTPRLNRINRVVSYRITPLGRQYLQFIDEPKK